MMTNYEKIELGAEAVVYIQEQLSSGRTLAHCILEKKNLEEGKTATILPSYVPMSVARGQFRQGVLKEPPPTHSKRVTKGGLAYRLVQKPTMDSHVAGYISDFLRSRENRYCLFEDVQAEPQDPWLSSPRARKLTIVRYNSEIYYGVSRYSSDPKTVLQTIKYANAGWYCLGIMVTLPPTSLARLKTRKQLTKEELCVLAERAEEIIIGAYDGESYLIWKDRRK